MNKITKEFLESEIISVEYNRLQGTLTHCAITVKSGFVFTGESACVDPNNFDKEIGEQIAYENAFEKMWLPYGFWLHKVLVEAGKAGGNNIEDVLPKTERLSFGDAVVALKEGLRVARAGWNGKGMFLYYVPENKYPASRNEHGTMVGVSEDDTVPYGAYIAMKTAQNNVVPWLASQTDVLAEDWVIAD